MDGREGAEMKKFGHWRFSLMTLRPRHHGKQCRSWLQTAQYQSHRSRQAERDFPI